MREIQCTLITLKFLKANRSIIVKNADPFIMEHSDEEILHNFNDSNDQLEATSFVRFPSGKTFKIELKSTEIASNCLDNGFTIFYLHVWP